MIDEDTYSFMIRELRGNEHKQLVSHSGKYVEFLFKPHNQPKAEVVLCEIL